MVIEPTPEQRVAADELRNRLTLWQTALLAALRRRGTASPDLENWCKELTRLVDLKYLGPRSVPAPRTRRAFEDAVGLLTTRIEEVVHQSASCLRWPWNELQTPIERFRLEIQCPDEAQWVIKADWRGTQECADVRAPVTIEEGTDLRVVQLAAARGTADEASLQTLQLLQRWGNNLFCAAFSGRVGSLYTKARDEAARRPCTLRIELAIDTALAGIPWEVLYDGREFAGVAHRVAIARRVGAVVTQPVANAPVPLRLLVVVSSPRRLDKVDRAAELQAVEEGVAPFAFMNLIQVDTCPDGKIGTIDRMLRAARDEGRPYHAFHFAGHGRYDETSGVGTIAMSGPDEEPHWVSAIELASLFRNHPPFRLAVMNACRTAQGDHQQDWSAASTLFRAGVQAVVAMQLAISHRAAKAFATELYGSLIDGATVDEAVTSGRRAILHLPNYVEWIRPVLLVGVEDPS